MKEDARTPCSGNPCRRLQRAAGAEAHLARLSSHTGTWECERTRQASLRERPEASPCAWQTEGRAPQTTR